MMKKLIKVLLLILTLALVVLVICQLILAYPGFLFEGDFHYRNFNILSNKEPGINLKRTLDSISTNLEKTGFYDDKEPVSIILCSNTSLTRFFEKISFAPVGAGFHHFSGKIYLFPERIDHFREENLKVKGEEQKLLEHTYQTFEFDKVLTHEILHKLHCDSLGIWKYKKMPSPHWKAEGFSEYYTFYLEKEKDNDYNFRDRVMLYLRYKDTFPLFYYKSQLLYEFLTEYRDMDFADIMQDEVTEQWTYDELMKWYHQNN